MAEKPASGLRGAVAGSESSWKEALLGGLGGIFYGLLSPVVGHPFDTVKSKMQAEAAYKNSSFFQTVSGTFRSEGIRGFYRGFIPPLLGSMAYRGAGFSAYSAAFSACSDVSFLSEPIPFTGGLRPCVLVGAFASSIARATIESPLDFIKLRMQIGKNVMQDVSNSSDQPTLRSASTKGGSSVLINSPMNSIRHLYHGYTTTLYRTMGLLGAFFVFLDYSVRYIPDVVNTPVVGPFFKGGICATAAWGVAFPWETAKSTIQADTTGKYKNSRWVTWNVMRQLYHDGGIKRLYRGFGPGAGRSFVANGVSMIVYSWFQDTARQQ